MATCDVVFTLKAQDATTDSTNVFSLFYRLSGTPPYGSSGALQSKQWQRVAVTGASTITLVQGEYYDFRMPFGRGEFSNKVCPASASTTLDALLDA